MFKNVAAKFMVFAFDATTNVPKTGDAANITAYVSKDYGAVTVLADTTATEMDATNAPGMYLFDAAQGETNADCLMVSGKSSTSNIKVIGAPTVIFTRPTTGWLAPTTAARTLDVSAGGEAGVDWANVGSPTTSLALTGTTIATTQKVDVETIKTNPVVNAGTITFPTGATLASTTNITAGTIATVTNQLTAATIAAGVWRDAVAADFTQASSIGLSVMNGIGLGTGLTIVAVSGAVGSVTGAVGSVTGAVGSVTGNVGGNVTGSVGTIAANGISASSISTGSLTAAKFAASAIDAAALATDAAQEIRDSVWAKVLSELTGDPTSTPAASDAVMLNYMALRNRRETTSTADKIENTAGTAILTAVLSDDGTTFTKAKYA